MPPSEPAANVLLVDDNPANLLSLRAIIDDLGQNLVQAGSGEEALRQVRSDEFAVILLDVLMPGLGGFETAKEIRSQERSRHTPIIFLTAGDIDRSQMEEGYRLGAVDFLGKPLLPAAVRGKVRGFVELFQDKQRGRREAEQLRLLVHGTADYAIFMLDPEGRIASWNPAAERIKGYKAEEIIGQHFSQFYPQEAIDRGWPAHELKVAQAEGRFEDEGWRLRKDGSRFWANVVITALRDDQGRLRGFSKVTRDLTARKQAEENLRRSEERFRLLVEGGKDYAIFMLDPQGHVATWNPGAERIKGYTAGEIIGQHFSKFYPQEALDRGWPAHELQVATAEGRFEDEGWRVRKDGSQFWANVIITALKDERGNLLGFSKITRDLTVRKQAEENARRLAEETAARQAAHDERERLRVTLASIGDAVISTDDRGRVEFLNPVAERLTGWANAEAAGQPLDAVFRIVNEDSRQPVENPATRALREGVVVGLANHTALIARDGGERPIDDSAAPIRDAGGRVVGGVLVFRDISERRRAERQRNARLAVTHALSEAATVEKGAGGVLRAVCENLGWDVGLFWTVQGQAEMLSCRQFWHRPGVPVEEFERASCSRTFAKGEGLPGRAWATGEPAWILDIAHDTNFPRLAPAVGHGLRSAFACPVIVGEQTLGVIEFFIRRIREPDPGLLEMMNTVAGQVGQFIERHEAEDRLRRSERELADFFENATEGLHWVGPDGTILRANRAELDLLGYTAEEYVGHKIAEFHADEGVIADILRRLQAGEELHNYEARLRCKDGSLRHVLINSNVMRRDGQFAHTRCFTRDVTGRKRNEAVLAGQKCVLELLVQGAPLPDVLDALCEVVEGQRRDGLIATVLLLDEDGQRLRSVAGRRAPADYARAVDGLRIGPCVGSCGTAAYRGEPVVVADIATDPLWAVAPDLRDLALGHGLRACWSTPILSSQGKVLGTFAVYCSTFRRPSADEMRLVDILARTAGVAVERRRAEEALKDADRRKDEFLATLAHELRNPLAPMRNALQVIQLAGGDVAAVGQAREMMERQMRHMVRLVDDLLDVSRITRGKLELRKQRVDLAAVVRTAVETSRPLVEAAGHHLTITLPPQPVFVDGDPVRLAQVFANLLNNAAKYTDRGGSIRLTAERQGSDAVVSVRDSGLGIPREMLGKVFELFTQVDSTLEKAQGGLGIGLTLVRRLAEMHGGSVEAHSEGLGKGSEFTVRLPALFVAPARDERAAEENTPSSRRRILVVDDNRDSAISLGMMLQLMGNEVRTAHDGLEAVQAAEVFRPDVVLLDIGLPKLNGYEAARRIRDEAWGRDMVLIAVTGWGQEEDKRRSKEAGFNFHMVKPVEPAALEKLLGGLLTPG
ncbi:MAG TPA: PAS domain S-box protein [Gemmataceae bacterium]